MHGIEAPKEGSDIENFRATERSVKFQEAIENDVANVENEMRVGQYEKGYEEQIPQHTNIEKRGGVSSDRK